MKIGDVIEVRNLGKQAWAKGKVVAVDKPSAGLLQVKVDHAGHELHGKLLTVDAEHYREVEQPKKEGNYIDNSLGDRK